MLLRRRIVRRLAGMMGMILLATSVLAGWRWTTGNVGIVEPGRIYRSAQLDAGTLSRLIRAKGIRTVLNLRGPNPGAEWYPAERLATTQAGATQIDVPLASDYWLTQDQADGLVELLDTADRPILIHCQFGAERTGLVSTIAVLLRSDSTLDEARSQFSPYFLFLPTEDGLVMRGHLRQYEDWLVREGIEHNSGAFRRWIGNAYQPGTPNRSQWPYDPYPLLVVTPPDDQSSSKVQVTRRPAQGTHAQ